MKNKVQSNYINYVNIYRQYQQIIKTSITSWGVCVDNNLNIHNIKNTGNTEEDIMRAQVLFMMKGDIISKIIEYTDKHISELKKYEIYATYKIEINFSKRFYWDESDSLKEERKIVTYTIKYYNKLGAILTDGYSSGLEELNIDNIKRILESQKQQLSVLTACKAINYVPSYTFLCFSPFTAAIVNHELFGHLFEIDNYSKILNKKNKLYVPGYISIYDSPNESLGGDCFFDDYGNILNLEEIIHNGIVSSLITNSDMLGSVRCRAGTKCFLPRVTNTIVDVSEKIDINFLESKIIFIEGITQASLKNDLISFTIDSSFIKIRDIVYKLPLIKIEIEVENIMRGIVGFFGNNAKYSTVDCIKRNQRCGGIGISSPGMILRIS